MGIHLRQLLFLYMPDHESSKYKESGQYYMRFVLPGQYFYRNNFFCVYIDSACPVKQDRHHVRSIC